MKLHALAALFVAVFGLLGLTGCARDTTIVLVRHAEKGGAGQDPPLSTAGLLRADALRERREVAGVSAIYVSNFQRTQQTAAPTAQTRGLTPIIIALTSSANAQAAEIARRIRTEHAGKRVLVVGHSNTVPLVMRELGIENPPTIAETEFNRMFVVKLKPSNDATFVETVYGP